MVEADFVMERIRLLFMLGIDFELPPGLVPLPLLLLLLVLIMSSELMLTLLVVKKSPEVETDPFCVEIDLRNVKSSLVPQIRIDASPEHVTSLVLIRTLYYIPLLRLKETDPKKEIL